MSLITALLVAGIVLFVVALALFRARKRSDAGAQSILKGGSAVARTGLLAWWLSLGLLAASVVLRLMQN